MSYILRVTSRDDHRSWIEPISSSTEYETLQEAKDAQAFILTEMPSVRFSHATQMNDRQVAHYRGDGWEHTFLIIPSEDPPAPSTR
jgi:hypothetical protein